MLFVEAPSCRTKFGMSMDPPVGSRRRSIGCGARYGSFRELIDGTADSPTNQIGY